MAWYRCVGGAGGSLKLRTASGAIATFNTNMVKAFKSLKSDINPVQVGTGTPSPQNVRPISGFSALNVTLADGDMQTVDTKTVNFGQTVYGGVADVTNGKVTITHIKITDFAQYYRDFFSGTYSTEYRITLPYPSTNVVYSVKRGSLCNCKEEETAYYGANQSSQSGSARDIFAINPLGEVLAIYDADTTLTKEQFEAKYSGNIEFVYELATPIEITTTPENLTALSGQNNVYSDTNGDTEVKYLYRE